MYKIRPEKRAQLCAINHVDDTGRLQSCQPRRESSLLRIDSRFPGQNRIPVLLNTSFKRK